MATTDMDQNNSDNSANHDLEQQLLNVLEFVTSPLKSDVKFPDLDDNSQAVKKAFTTLKKSHSRWRLSGSGSLPCLAI